ncbi:hypothetical protein LR48_Vigan05g106000 [Vigna angularis]|uniref:Uncharacterized protein n=1 Tax=Phaseolus angularis TaxID=3914 RepID=A0A0L9ULA3_PHAAN|nr:hypothetical protein LR48_Vigan05g106000 [Vigna angularis]
MPMYEPLSNLLGKEYFLHAYGPIYALSADVVSSLVALKNNRWLLPLHPQDGATTVQRGKTRFDETRRAETVQRRCGEDRSRDGAARLESSDGATSFRMFSNEDVTIGAWMLAMNVNHENSRELCAPECTSTSIVVWDIPKCSGLCNPEKRMLELHQQESCAKSPTLDSDE